MITPTFQVWILAPDIGHCSAKNQVRSDKSCFTTDTGGWCEFKKTFWVTYVLKLTRVQWIIDLSCSGFPFYEYLNRLFIQIFIFKTVGCVWVKIFYTNTLLFFCPTWDRIPSENVYMSLHSVNIYMSLHSVNVYMSLHSVKFLKKK